MRWKRNFVDTLYGRPRHILLAISYQAWDTLGIFAMGTYFAEGIGMTANLTPEGGGYRLRGARIAGTVCGTITSVDDGTNGGVRREFALMQNYPNPFNPSTSIKYQIPNSMYVTLKICDVLGREVATLVNEVKEPGMYTVHWNADGLASGVYFYRLNAGDFILTRKLIVLR